MLMLDHMSLVRAMKLASFNSLVISPLSWSYSFGIAVSEKYFLPGGSYCASSVASIFWKLSLSTVWNGTDSFTRYLATAVVHWAHFSLPCLYLVDFAKAADIVGCRDAFVLNPAAAPDLAVLVGGSFATSEGWWTRMCPNKFVICLSFIGTQILHIVQIGCIRCLGSPLASRKNLKYAQIVDLAFLFGIKLLSAMLASLNWSNTISEWGH